MGDSRTRIRKELKELLPVDDSGVSACSVDDSLDHLRGTIKGPDATPFAGGVFHVDIIIPQTYPFEPPKMKFTTKVWHPNVSSQTGAICLDILKDQWSPALTVKTALMSIQALLTAAEPDDPQDAQVAAQYKADRAAYDSTARFWTETYAMPKDAAKANADPKVSGLVAMGFPTDTVVKVLAECGYDENAALDKLLGGGGEN